MPYIPQKAREEIAEGRRPTNPGELNYLISLLLKSYWTHSARNYQAINDIVGAVEGAKIEFQRRIVQPYENLKIDQNGDIYE